MSTKEQARKTNIIDSQISSLEAMTTMTPKQKSSLYLSRIAKLLLEKNIECSVALGNEWLLVSKEEGNADDLEALKALIKNSGVDNADKVEYVEAQDRKMVNALGHELDPQPTPSLGDCFKLSSERDADKTLKTIKVTAKVAGATQEEEVIPCGFYAYSFKLDARELS